MKTKEPEGEKTRTGDNPKNKKKQDFNLMKFEE